PALFPYARRPRPANGHRRRRGRTARQGGLSPAGTGHHYFATVRSGGNGFGGRLQWGGPAAGPQCRQGGFFMFGATTHLPDQHNLVKVPCWRWLRCCYLLDHGRRPLRQDDDATRQAWLFRRTLTCCRTDADREQLARDSPGLAEAHAVYTG